MILFGDVLSADGVLILQRAFDKNSSLVNAAWKMKFSKRTDVEENF
jgi:hypothetical protein